MCYCLCFRAVKAPGSYRTTWTQALESSQSAGGSRWRSSTTRQLSPTQPWWGWSMATLPRQRLVKPLLQLPRAWFPSLASSNPLVDSGLPTSRNLISVSHSFKSVDIRCLNLFQVKLSESCWVFLMPISSLNWDCCGAVAPSVKCPSKVLVWCNSTNVGSNHTQRHVITLITLRYNVVGKS